MSATRGAAPSRPVWVPEPFLVRARTGFAWAAVSGVLGAVVIWLGRVVGDDDGDLVILALLALILLTITVACVALFLIAAAAGRGPGDAMSTYGAGRRVEVTWTSHGHERGRVEVEDVGEGEVVVLRRHGADQSSHVTVALGGHHLVLQGGPSASAPEWYTLVDDDGRTVARADAARCPGVAPARAAADWTVRPVRGPALRLRHRPAAAVPTQVTLLDENGTAWWVRDGRLAELPDDLDPASAVFLVLMVDQLRRLARARPEADAS